jgi:two-component system sensor histidine kinase CpxA
MVLVRAYEDRKFWFFLVVPRRPFFQWFLHPHYLWILGLAVLLCYGLAKSLSAPLRKLQQAVEAFGKGDLSARANLNRRDEFGKLSRDFDKMADRIQLLMQAQARLLLDISHELRSPLARLGVAVELARTGDDRDAALNRIQKEADRLNTLVGELLQVTRAEVDPAIRRRETIRLDRLIADTVEDCVIEADSCGCQLRFENAPEVSIAADPELLRRAVENVIRNSIRHAPADTAIDVTLDSNPARELISIRDRGPGVPEEALTKIFDAFYRVDPDRNRSSGGVGLGLAIARRAVELHNGRLRAKNVDPGLLVEIELLH